MTSDEKQAAVLAACAKLMEAAPVVRPEAEALLFTAALAWSRWTADHDAQLHELLREHFVALPAVRLMRRCLAAPRDVKASAFHGAMDLPSGAYLRVRSWCGAGGPHGTTDPVLVTCPGCRRKLEQGLIRHLVVEVDGRDATACGCHIRTEPYVWIGLPNGERPGVEYTAGERRAIQEDRFEIPWVDESLRDWLGDGEMEIEGVVHDVDARADGEGIASAYAHCSTVPESVEFAYDHGVPRHTRWDGVLPKPYPFAPVDPALPRCDECFGEHAQPHRENRHRLARMVAWMRENVRVVERKVTASATLTLKPELVTCKNCLKKME